MSEIASNFKISLDLFELITFDTNDDLQTTNQTVTQCPNVALRILALSRRSACLLVIDTLVFFSANIAFQNTPDTIVQRIGSRRFW